MEQPGGGWGRTRPGVGRPALVAIIGAGRVGTVLGVLLERAGYRVAAVSGRRSSYERAQAHPAGVERGDGERDVELAKDRLRVGHAQPLEAGILHLAAEVAPAGERLREEDDAEPRRRARHDRPHPSTGSALTSPVLTAPLSTA